MLCSPRELAISQEHETGILILPADLTPGADLKTALGLDDALLDIEVEPNRPDFLSVYGVARETSSILGLPLADPDTDLEEEDERADAVATVELLAPDGCPSYLARILRGCVRGATPIRVQARLTAAGMRPVAPIVDATNYAMLELGQPLHAFDLDRLAGPGIVVRRAGAGERLTTLDGVDRELIDEDLLICDLEKPVALAGVMGGRSSEVSASTADVLLESRVLHQDGGHPDGPSARPAFGGVASLRARDRSRGGGAGRPPVRGADRSVDGRPRAGGRRAGGRPAPAALGLDARFPGDGAPGLPRRLVGCRGRVRRAPDVAPRGRPTCVEVEIPGYRPDIEREVDLIEEVVRIQGYEGVGATVPRSPELGGLPDGLRVRAPGP